jgi:hypothetical protein
MVRCMQECATAPKPSMPVCTTVCSSGGQQHCKALRFQLLLRLHLPALNRQHQGSLDLVQVAPLLQHMAEVLPQGVSPLLLRRQLLLQCCAALLAGPQLLLQDRLRLRAVRQPRLQHCQLCIAQQTQLV